MQLAIGIILGHVLTMIGVWVVDHMRARRIRRYIEQSATTLKLKDCHFDGVADMVINAHPKWSPRDFKNNTILQ